MTTPRLKFIQDSHCTSCPLYKTCLTVCIPTVPYRISHAGVPKVKAVLVLGEAPGGEEDKLGEPFVGKSGQFLKNAYVDHWRLWEKADVYLGNAVRCRPPGNDTPSKAQIKACSRFLREDLKILEDRYEEVVVLCVGAVAAQAMGHKSLKKAFGAQLAERPIPPPPPPPPRKLESFTEEEFLEACLDLPLEETKPCSHCAHCPHCECGEGRRA